MPTDLTLRYNGIVLASIGFVLQIRLLPGNRPGKEKKKNMERMRK